MAADAQEQLRAYVEYLRDMDVHDFYRRGEPIEPIVASPRDLASLQTPEPPVVPLQPVPVPVASPAVPSPLRGFQESSIPKLVSFDDLAPLPQERIAVSERAAALQTIHEEIGDCTRCPLAYAGRRNIVFGEGDPAARLMFVGEGPGADEDASGRPFVGKAGQLLNNMIGAMGLKREEVYIANIVKCRPPGKQGA